MFISRSKYVKNSSNSIVLMIYIDYISSFRLPWVSQSPPVIFNGYRSITASGGTACDALILILEHPQDFKQRKNPRELASSIFVGLMSCKQNQSTSPVSSTGKLLLQISAVLSSMLIDHCSAVDMSCTCSEAAWECD